MAAIDLSKAKIGDKFRTKLGYVVIFTGLYRHAKKYKYMFDRVDDKYCGCCCDINGVPIGNKETYTIVEQVLDKPLDELIKEATKQFRENDDAIAEENELQRRHEVVELAEKLWLRNLKDLAEYSYFDAFKDAETFIKLKVNYLKEGKLC